MLKGESQKTKVEGQCAMELVEELHVMPRARAGVMESLTAAAQWMS